MISFKQYSLFLAEYCALSCSEAAKVIVYNASRNNSYGVTALAAHGLIESVNDPVLGAKIKMIVPDGRPIVWALNSFYNLGLKFNPPGPSLTLDVLALANTKKLNVVLFGSTADTRQKFQNHISEQYPNISVVGVHEDRFRDATPEEGLYDIERINASGAHVVLVGRVCPRQEHWVADHLGKVDAAMLAVGVAFDCHTGKLVRAPLWVQKSGLEWLFRLIQEPQRLWRRYLSINLQFIKLCVETKIPRQLPSRGV
jgi:exopolysaccharide biosynthesis WecB/TagA/CpsF family protein